LPPAEEPLLGLVKDDYWRIAQFGGLGMIALLLIFFVMRPLIKALLLITTMLANRKPFGAPGALRRRRRGARLIPAGGAPTQSGSVQA
jgi:hypothetical protein